MLSWRIPDDETDRIRSRCQQKVLKSLHKCTRTSVKFSSRCKKKRLGARIVDADTLGECVYADEGRVINGCIPIRKDLDRLCFEKGVDLVASFPGCGAADVVSTTACLFGRARCRVCLAVREAGDLLVDCDVFDDETSNGSCP